MSHFDCERRVAVTDGRRPGRACGGRVRLASRESLLVRFDTDELERVRRHAGRCASMCLNAPPEIALMVQLLVYCV